MDEEEEELKEFDRDETIVGDEEIDMDYEFDAARFHDFARGEADSEAAAAERWFDSAGDYPPSPFIIKLNWRQGIPKSKAVVEELNDNNRGLNNESSLEISDAKSKCRVKSTVPRNSTLMKPTASHLAKQNQLAPSIRLKKKLGKIDEKSSQRSSITDDIAPKRQKLEDGYLSKEAQVKHKASMLHKVRLNGVTANARPRTTIPREPDLETAHRAERRRYKAYAESGEEADPTAYTFKARVTNRKIVKAPFLRVTRRNERQEAEFAETRQVPCCNSSHNKMGGSKSTSLLLSSNSMNRSRKEKCETFNDFEILSTNGKFCLSRNIRHTTTKVTRGLNVSTDKRFQQEPPINLFSKLCITSEAQQNTKTHPVEVTRGKNLGSYPENKMINVVKRQPERLSRNDFGHCGRGGTIPDQCYHLLANYYMEL